MSDQPESPALLPSALELVAPVSPADPVGDDPKYSVEFEFVKAEIAKTTERDWEQIHLNARQVLTSQAKDITLLCYGLLASTVAKGWSEGAAMAQAMAQLCREHWDTLHPQRERARQNAFKWLTEERTLGTFAQVAVGSGDHEALSACAAALNEVKGILNERFPDAPPSIKPLIQFVEEKAKSTKPAPAAAPAPAPRPASSGAESAPAAASAPLAAPAVGDGASKSDLMAALRKIALSLSGAEPDNPLGYKLLRISRWQEIAVAPKNDKGVTTFPPPNPQRAAFLEGQCAQRSWAPILEKSEPAFTEPGLHFWLDLQYYAVQAFQGKGQEPCAEAIRQELRALLKRVPQLADLKYNDGTPFANGTTKAWLEELQQDGAGVARSSAAAREETLESDLEAAKELASSGKVSEALDVLQAGLIYGDLRSRTMRQLEISRLALQHGKIRAALAVATEIAERAERMSLAAWEPGLARAISEVLLKSLNAAIEAGAGDVTDLTRRRENAALRAGMEDPALISRFDF